MSKVYNRQEYIRQLDRLLRKLPAEERFDAVAFYAEYLADAGPGREAEVIRNLGTPAQVAAGVRADAAMRQLDEGKPRMKNGVTAVWLAVLGVFALPVALPIAAAGFAVIIALLAAVFAILVSLIASAFAIFVSGIVTVVVGFVALPQDVSAGLFYIGGGLACTGLGLLFGILFWQIGRVTLRGIAKLFNHIRYSRMKKKAAKGAQSMYAQANAQNTAQTTQNTYKQNTHTQAGAQNTYAQADAQAVHAQTDTQNAYQNTHAQTDAQNTYTQTGENTKEQNTHAQAAEYAYEPGKEGAQNE